MKSEFSAALVRENNPFPPRSMRPSDASIRAAGDSGPQRLPGTGAALDLSQIVPAKRSRTTPDNQGMTQPYLPEQPLRADIDAMRGAVVLDFGTNWCSICNAAQPLVDAALAGQALRHVKVEDGAGRALGRSFGVKLWPTLVFLRDGMEVGRLVRPQSGDAITQELARLA
jgi:thioredoxin 1